MSQRNERSTQPDLDSVIHWLIHHAAQRAPESLSSRLEEEWLADLQSRSSALSRLRFTVGCCWATMVIVSEHPRSRTPVASSATAARGFVTLADRNFGYFSLRSGTLFLIAGLHAAVLYGLITTLSHTPVHATPPNLQNNVVKPVPPEKLPLTLPGSAIKSWKIDVQKLVVDLPPKIDVENDVTTEVVDKSLQPHSPQLPPEAPTHVVHQALGGPGPGFPDTADFYPSLSVHLEEQGISAVRVCVDPKGRLASDPAIVRGSGSARLDAAALKLARAGSGHYRATTEDGQPVNSCYSMGIRFQLKN
jgi:Gram-negative bacterial TonB protein C-terminal